MRVAAHVVEVGVAGEEARVGADVDGQAEQRLPRVEHRRDAPLARFGDDDAVGRVARDRAGDLAGEAAGVVGIVEADVVDVPARLHQRRGMVAHRREDVGDLLAVVADVGRLVGDLHHQHDRVGGRGPIQRRQVERQLVAQHRDQRFHPPSMLLHGRR